MTNDMPKILVIAPSWIGDCVMAQPLLMLLRQHNPQAVIDVFAPNWSLAVMKRMPEINRTIENPFLHGDIKLFARYRVGRSLRAENYTQAIVLPGSLKSALVPYFAKIPKRTGFVGENRYGLLNDIRPLDELLLPKMVDRFASLAFEHSNRIPQGVPMPHLVADANNQHACLQKFNLHHDKPIVAMCSGAEYGIAKRWPEHHFAAAAQQCQQKGYQVWFFGSKKDAAGADNIIHISGGVGVNLCGKTSLDEAVDLLALSQAVICNDSGLMHIAAALDLPLVAIYGSSSPDHTPPLSDKAHILSLNMSCSPCFERTCPFGHTDCLEKLPVDMVMNALDELIAKYASKTV